MHPTSARPIRTAPLAHWSRRQRWLFVLFSFALMLVGIHWLMRGGWQLWAGLLAMSLSVPMVAYSCRSVSRTETGPMSPAERRFLIEFSFSMPVYFVLVILLWGHARQMDQGWLRALVAVSPALPVAWLSVAFTRMILGSDELMQRIHLQALAVSAGAVSILSMALGFLAAAKVLALKGDILLWVFPVLAWVYGSVRWWLMRRLGRGD